MWMMWMNEWYVNEYVNEYEKQLDQNLRMGPEEVWCAADEVAETHSKGKGLVMVKS